MISGAEPVLTVAQMRAAEEGLIAAGETVDSLMLKAGKGSANWVWRISGHLPVTVLCGPGNNGGDGYVIAEALRSHDVPVTVVAPMEPATDAAKNARSAYQGTVVTTPEGLKGAVFVDCLFGSGLTRPLSDPLLSTIRVLAENHRCAVAVDVPSGIESDSGAILNDGLPDYRLTIALGAWKRAHWIMPSSAIMGGRRLVSIGSIEGDGADIVMQKPSLSAPVPDAHKYRRGLVAVVSGAMPGAGVLAARAAMHAGAGYVKLLAQGEVPAGFAELVLDRRPLVESLADHRISALLCGPGLGRGDEARSRLLSVLGRDLPTVLDADALMLRVQKLVDQRKAPLILTPHEGELEQLCQTFSIASASKVERARALASTVNATIIAKGPDTLVASPDGRMVFCPPATSWLSVAGTGDVLAGIVASRLASGAEPLEAACQAVWLHSEAARLAGPAFVAGELAAQLPRAYSACL